VCAHGLCSYLLFDFRLVSSSFAPLSRQPFERSNDRKAAFPLAFYKRAKARVANIKRAIIAKI
jgi:hypothetical protein